MRNEIDSVSVMSDDSAGGNQLRPYEAVAPRRPNPQLASCAFDSAFQLKLRMKLIDLCTRRSDCSLSN